VVERSTPNAIDHLREMAERIIIAEVEEGRGRAERQRGEGSPVGAMEGSEREG
jgi:hypothetical protein